MVAGSGSQLRAAVRPAFGLLLCLGLLLAGCGGAAAPACGTEPCTRVLFLGNSYTYVNDLPSTFARLATSGGRQVEVSSVANGGETLAQHAAASDSLDAISSRRWTYVILQEQSETPATWAGRTSMYPAVRTLAGRIESAGATPMLFMTWAHRDGLPTAGLADYGAMQQQIDNAYLAIAQELGVPVAPVGYTWSLVRQDHPEIGLWGDDGSHPSGAGTYLAACVFYASIFRASPVGLTYYGGVGADQARLLQDEAGRRVLDPKAQWGLR
jgi:hypothetical protein